MTEGCLPQLSSSWGMSLRSYKECGEWVSQPPSLQSAPEDVPCHVVRLAACPAGWRVLNSPEKTRIQIFVLEEWRVAAGGERKRGSQPSR